MENNYPLSFDELFYKYLELKKKLDDISTLSAEEFSALRDDFFLAERNLRSDIEMTLKYKFRNTKYDLLKSITASYFELYTIEDSYELKKILEYRMFSALKCMKAKEYQKTIQFIIQLISKSETKKLKEINSSEEEFIENNYYSGSEEESSSTFVKKAKRKIKGKLKGCSLVTNILQANKSNEEIVNELSATSIYLSDQSMEISHNKNGEYKEYYNELEVLELNAANSVFYFINNVYEEIGFL